MGKLNYRTTKDIKVSEKIVDQVIGQEHGIEIIKKAANQRRNVLLIGEPGTGKSMIGQALAGLLPQEKLQDILAFDNPQDENIPLIRVVPKGKGGDFVLKAKLQSMSSFRNQNLLLFIFILFISIFPYYLWKSGAITDIIYAASLITGVIFILGFVLILNINKKTKQQIRVPKLLIDNSKTKNAPFIDATGAHAGALLGDVLHDPLQCFSPKNKIMKNPSEIEINREVNSLLNKYNENIIKKQDYKAVYLPKKESYVIGEKNGRILKAEILSVNKHLNKKGELLKITTASGKELFVTPEHKICINKKGKKEYIEAKKIRKSQEVFVLE